MILSLDTELAKLTAIAAEKGVTTKRIPASDVIVSDWVRFKCRFGCKGYAKHFGCPPYAPSPHETRAMVGEYQTGLLLRFDGVPGHESFGPDEPEEKASLVFTDQDRKSTRLNSSHSDRSRMPSSA